MPRAPAVSAPAVDKSAIADSQVRNGGSTFAERLRLAIGQKGWKPADLIADSGVPKGRVYEYLKGPKEPTAAYLFALANSLGASAEWLATGKTARSQTPLLDAADADWVPVPEYDLRELTDESRGAIVSRTPIRRDWLNRTFGQTSGLWLARLPADLPVYDLREGDLAIMRDTLPGEAQDGAIYVARIFGHLTVTRLDALQSASNSSIDTALRDRRLDFRHIGPEDGQAILVARVLGVPLKRL